MFIFPFIAAFSESYTEFIIMRFLYGISIGFSAPITSTYLSEITPSRLRAKYFIYMAALFPIGELFVVLAAYYLMDSLSSGNWRALQVYAAVPGLIKLISLYFFLF